MTTEQSPSGSKIEGLVAPIKWGKTSYGRPEATTILGVYRVNKSMSGGWAVSIGSRVLQTDDGRSNFPTEEGAQSAAQSDYATRILSAVPALIDRIEALEASEADPVKRFAQWQHQGEALAAAVGCSFVLKVKSPSSTWTITTPKIVARTTLSGDTK